MDIINYIGIMSKEQGKVDIGVLLERKLSELRTRKVQIAHNKVA